MTKITGGVVSVEDGTKKAEEYSPARKVRVELHFDVPEGEDAQKHVDLVTTIAEQRVAASLQFPLKIVPHAQASAANAKEALAKAAGVDDAAVAAATKKTPGRKASTAAAPKLETPPTQAPVADAAAVVEEPEAAADPFAVVEEATATPAKEITDKDLHDAMSRKAGELKNPVPVREVVKQFKPADHAGQFIIQQLPQEKRQAFLDTLAKLKA